MDISLNSFFLPLQTFRMKKAWKDRQEMAQSVYTGFTGEKKPEEGVSSKKARAHYCLQTGGRYKRLVEKSQEGHWAGKSSIIPLALPR
jgi:N-acetyl-anhydromuramyl-L-alanine amidase AmpD